MLFCYFNSTFDTNKYSDNSRLRIFNGDMLEKICSLISESKKETLEEAEHTIEVQGDENTVKEELVQKVLKKQSQIAELDKEIEELKKTSDLKKIGKNEK